MNRLADEFGAVFGRFHRIDAVAVDCGDRTEQGRLTPGSCTQVEPAACVRTVQFRPSQRECDELTPLVLHCRHAFADRLQFAGIAAAVEVDRIRRPLALIAARHQGQFLGGDIAGASHQMDDRPSIVGRQHVPQLPGPRTERIRECLRDPHRMREFECQPPHRILRREFIHPRVDGLLPRPPQNSIHETRLTGTEFRARQGHRRIHCRMRPDPGSQQLIDPETQHIQQRPIDLLDRTPGARRDHRVQQPERTAGSIGQFGCQCGIPPRNPPLAQQPWQH